MFFVFGLLFLGAGFFPALFAGITYGLLMGAIINRSNYYLNSKDRLRQYLSGLLLGMFSGIWGGAMGVISGGVVGAVVSPFLIRASSEQKLSQLFSTIISKIILVLAILSWAICLNYFGRMLLNHPKEVMEMISRTSQLSYWSGKWEG